MYFLRISGNYYFKYDPRYSISGGITWVSDIKSATKFTTFRESTEWKKYILKTTKTKSKIIKQRYEYGHPNTIKN